MRLNRTAPIRATLGGVALALVAGACSIQAPDVQFVGQGGQAGLQPGVPVPAGSLGAGQTFGGGKVGGQSVGGTDQSGDTSCKGKATDVGITGSTIKLGTTFAISGPVSNISGPIKKGVEAYFNEVNAQGGVNGRKIQLKYYDDGWDAQKGKGAIKNLVERDKVFVLTTVPSSNGLDAAKSYLESKRVPVFGTSGLIETQFRSPMQWPIGTSTRSSARIAVQDVTNRIGAKNMAIIWLDLLAGAEAREAFKKEAAKRGLAIVADRRVSISEPDYGQVWADVKNQTRGNPNGSKDGIPDFIGLFIDPSSALKALRAAQNLGFKPKKGWGGGAPLFLKLVLDNSSGYAADTGLYAGTSFIPALPEFDNIPGVAAYKKTVLKYFSNVDLLNPYLEGGYAGAALTVEILRRAGTCLTRKKVIEIANSLTNFSAGGLTKPLTYSPFGQGRSHYGNLSGLLVQATDKGWKAVMAGPDGGWYRDLTPGSKAVFILQLIILGLPIGILWALLATSVVMIYRASRVLNLAIGGMAMLGAYSMYQIHAWGVPLPFAVLGALAFGGLFGVVMERLLLRPLRDKPILVSVIMTVGVLAMCTELASVSWGQDERLAPELFPRGALTFGDAAVGYDRIGVLIVTLVIMAAVIYLFRRTTLGISMRAVSDDRRAALLMGVPADRVSTITWAIGGVLAAVAGMLLSPIVRLTPNGLVFQSIPALAAALFGGLVSIELTFGGAMALGVLWSVLAGLSIGSFRVSEIVGVQEVAIFLLVITFLWVRWEQLFGSELREEEI